MQMCYDVNFLPPEQPCGDFSYDSSFSVKLHIVELMCHQRRFHKCVTGNYFYFSILMLWSFSVNTFCLAVKSNKLLWHLMCLNISDKYVFFVLSFSVFSHKYSGGTKLSVWNIQGLGSFHLLLRLLVWSPPLQTSSFSGLEDGSPRVKTRRWLEARRRCEESGGGARWSQKGTVGLRSDPELLLHTRVQTMAPQNVNRGEVRADRLNHLHPHTDPDARTCSIPALQTQAVTHGDACAVVAFFGGAQCWSDNLRKF